MHPQPSRPVLLILAALGVALMFPQPSQAEDWKEVVHGKDLVVSTRPRAGSPIAEVRAVGAILASPATVKAVLDDRDHYPEFMPYVAETRVLSQNAAAHTLVAYMRLNPPIVGQRDYTILVRDEPRPAAGGGTTYVNRWELANDKGPAEQAGVVRVKVNEGSWVLEPADNGQTTRATYTLFTDAGGAVPAFVVNTANKRSLSELFAAVRRAAANPKYRRGP